MEEKALDSKVFSDVQSGKRVGEHLYLHISALALLPPTWLSTVSNAIQLTMLKPELDYNVVKLHEDGDQLSLLDYPSFLEDPFPTLARSWRVSLSRGTTIFRTYVESRNPPILHRKELLLGPDNPRRPGFAEITEAAEAIGLFSDPHRIGFREHWYRLISERGYEIVGSEFVPLANALIPTESDASFESTNVRRHLTALTRSGFSAPIQALARHGLLRPGVSFFDYGCGRGDDVRGLLANSIEATGWDPHFLSDAKKHVADVVNIGFVINVIEDMEERIEALSGAYACAKGVLAIAAMLSSQTMPEGRPYNDGYVTTRRTFQKYFTQAQLRDFIEHTLEENAIACGPGVFLVFRDKSLEQRFLSERYGRRAPTILSRGWVRERQLREKVPRISRDTRVLEANHDLFQGLWLKMLELGRRPDPSEVGNIKEVEAVAGSLPKAMRLVEKHFDIRELDLSRVSRTADIVVFLAMMQFEKRKPYRHLESRLQRDIRYFFGDYTSAQDQSKHVLYGLGDIAAIDRACREAFERGLGWLEESHSLQLHVSLVERLPAVLRILIGCATVLFGDISTFDLVKIHVRSGKVSLMKYEDFESSPLPRLLQRVKVRLMELDVDIFDYGAEFVPTLLYRKSRYINEEFHRYAEQVTFEEDLERLGLVDLSAYGPSEAEFRQKLEAARWAIDGFSLIRSNRIPDLDEPCGAYLTYRQLVECGETQARIGLPNLPKQPDSYTALYELCLNILDPVIEYFGMVNLTYGFCAPELSRIIAGRIAPNLDQHAACERNSRGNLVCERGGCAVDFLVSDEDMENVADWIIESLPFDRLYFYGPDCPIHVSFGLIPQRLAYRMLIQKGGRLLPKSYRKILG